MNRIRSFSRRLSSARIPPGSEILTDAKTNDAASASAPASPASDANTTSTEGNAASPTKVRADKRNNVSTSNQSLSGEEANMVRNKSLACQNIGCGSTAATEADARLHSEDCPFRRSVCGLTDTEASQETLNYPGSRAICSFTCRFQDLAEHQALCEMRRTPCPNSACDKSPSFRSVHVHVSRCLFQPVECPNNTVLRKFSSHDTSSIWFCSCCPLRRDVDVHTKDHCLLSCPPDFFDRQLQKGILGLQPSRSEREDRVVSLVGSLTTADAKAITRSRMRFQHARRLELESQVRDFRHQLAEMQIEVNALRKSSQDSTESRFISTDKTMLARGDREGFVGKYYITQFHSTSRDVDLAWLEEFRTALAEYEFQVRKYKERAKLMLLEQSSKASSNDSVRLSYPSSAPVFSVVREHLRSLLRLQPEGAMQPLHALAPIEHPIFVAYERIRERLSAACTRARKNRDGQASASSLSRVLKFELELLASSIFATYSDYDQLRCHPVLGADYVSEREPSDSGHADCEGHVSSAVVDVRFILEQVLIAEAFPMLLPVFTERFKAEDKKFASRVAELQHASPRDFLIRREFCIRVDGEDDNPNRRSNFSDYVFSIGAVNLLRTLPTFHTPHDLAKCVVATMQLISNSVGNHLSSIAVDTVASTKPRGIPVVSADDLLPMLVYSLVHAFVPASTVSGNSGSGTPTLGDGAERRVVSLVRFMIDFGYGDESDSPTGELGYALALVDSAVRSILACDPAEVLAGAGVSAPGDSAAARPDPLDEVATVEGFARQLMLSHKKSHYHDAAIELCKTRFIARANIPGETILFYSGCSFPHMTGAKGLFCLTEFRCCFVSFSLIHQASSREVVGESALLDPDMFILNDSFSVSWKSVSGVRRTKSGPFMDSGLDLYFPYGEIEPLRLARMKQRDLVYVACSFLHDRTQRRLVGSPYEHSLESATDDYGSVGFHAGGPRSISHCYTFRSSSIALQPPVCFPFGSAAEEALQREFFLIRDALISGHFPGATSTVAAAAELAACIAHSSGLSAFAGPSEQVLGEFTQEKAQKFVNNAAPGVWHSVSARLFPPDRRCQDRNKHTPKDIEISEAFLRAWQSLVGVSPMNTMLYVVAEGRFHATQMLKKFKLTTFFVRDMSGNAPKSKRTEQASAAAMLSLSNDHPTARIAANAVVSLMSDTNDSLSAREALDMALYAAHAHSNISAQHVFPVIVGISREAFLIIDIASLEVMQEHKFSSIKRWKYRAPIFFVEFKIDGRLQVYSFWTLEGVQIQAAMHTIIDATLSQEM